MTHTLGSFLHEGKAALEEKGAPSMRDLRRLVAMHMEVSEAHVLAFPEKTIPPPILARLTTDLNDLVAGRPAAYIFGSVPFLDLNFAVDERALIPRPETEALANLILQETATCPPKRILDLCCGSGVLGLTLGTAYPTAQITLTDLSEPALELCRENAARLGLSDRTQILAGDLFDALKTTTQSDATRFDLIAANPPYVAGEDLVEDSVLGHEPHMALYSPDSGMAHIKIILAALPQYLTQDGLAAFELGHYHHKSLKPWLKDRFPSQKISWRADPFGVMRFLFYDSRAVKDV